MPCCFCHGRRRQRSPPHNHKCTQTPTGGELSFWSFPCSSASRFSSDLSKKLLHVQTWHVGHAALDQSIFAFMWNLSQVEWKVKGDRRSAMLLTMMMQHSNRFIYKAYWRLKVFGHIPNDDMLQLQVTQWKMYQWYKNFDNFFKKNIRNYYWWNFSKITLFKWIDQIVCSSSKFIFAYFICIIFFILPAMGHVLIGIVVEMALTETV